MDLLEARRRKFSAREYRGMIEVGILYEDEHVELIAGELFDSKSGERRLFTADEYFRMGETGILREDDRVELIEGEIVEMSPIGSRHAACVNRLIKLLVSKVGDAGIVGAQNPVVLPDDSGPQPDVAVLRPREDFYAEAHPTPGDVLLLVEVSDTTLRYDREVKLPLYALAGVPEVWIVDLRHEEILTYSRPEGEAYKETGRAGRDASVASSILLGFVLNVYDVLG